MRTAAVILNFRTPELTLDCLASLEGQLRAGDEAIVVDNGSSDGSVERIESSIRRRGWRWARQIRSESNRGFAGGNNLGIRAADADLYLLLNSDTVVQPGAVAALREAAHEHPRAGIVGPSFLGADGRPSRSAFRAPGPLSELVRASGIGALTRVLPRSELPVETSGQPQEVEWIGFACALVRREVVADIGLLDEGYFLYFEDVDYCLRAARAGWSILYWPAARVVHFEGGSSRLSPGRRLTRAPRYYYASRARYFAKFHGRAGLIAANLAWTAGHAAGWARAGIDGRRPPHRRREALDIWTDALRGARGDATWRIER
ncbi:MAG: glycosyltransferase family 2 protein [Sandaracinaceae bacterium]|nr:glycosyltransferase family 2 protein [Sandaracinaceae bacterium]